LCDHSITSSARVRKDSGIVNPSALAVVRLIQFIINVSDISVFI
jgi:hypothetical protein